MGPLFHVGQSTYYYSLIPKHLADLLCFPKSVLSQLEKGGFVLNICGNNYSYVALDEGLETTMNKEVMDNDHRKPTGNPDQPRRNRFDSKEILVDWTD